MRDLVSPDPPPQRLPAQTLPGQIVRQARKARLHRLVSAMPALVEVVAGVKEVQGAGLTLSVPAGGFVLLPEGLALTVCNLPDAAGRYEARALPLPRPLVERALSRRPDLTRPRTAQPQVLDGLPPEARALQQAFFGPATLPADILALRLEELILWLALDGALLPPEGPPRLSERLRARIAADPAAPWSAPRAAALMAMSEATLRRHLAAEGTGFADLLRDTRLTHALGLLQTTPFAVARVAEEAGYASPQQFAMRFRARFGLAPHEIRLAERPIDRNAAKSARRAAVVAPKAG